MQNNLFVRYSLVLVFAVASAVLVIVVSKAYFNSAPPMALASSNPAVSSDGMVKFDKPLSEEPIALNQIDPIGSGDEGAWEQQDGRFAQELAPDAEGYLARIELNSPDELLQALQRAELLHKIGKAGSESKPLAFVLHGPEVSIFYRKNYNDHQNVVDLAAKLSALNVIDVKVCRARLSANGVDESVLVPFVDTVAFGPAEVKRLINKERYAYF